MSITHAVVRIDHSQAQVLQFDAEHLESQRVKSHSHPTAQHGSQVRTQHEFFGHVCDAIDPIEQVLVAGAHQALTDFERYVNGHRPHTAKHIVAYEVVDHPTENQLVALARRFFLVREITGGLDPKA